MRTRSRTIDHKVSKNPETLAGSPTYNTTTGCEGLPINYVNGASSTPYEIPAARDETIADEGKTERPKGFAGVRIRSVSHRKFTSEGFKTYSRFSPTLVGICFDETGSKIVYYPQKAYKDVSHCYGLFADAMAASRWVNNPVNWGLNGAITVPNQDQGRLAAKALSKMEELHLTTTAIEARELPELFRMFTHRGSLVNAAKAASELLENKRYIDALGQFQKASRYARPKKMKELIHALGDSQLGYFFGLQPTIADVKNIATAIKKAKRPRRIGASVFVRNTNNLSDRHSLDGLANSLEYLNGRSVETLAATRVDGLHTVCERPSFYSQSLNDLSEKIDRYAGYNPAGLLWEVIPYSWAVDWFLSIDDVLDTLFLNGSRRFENQWWTSTKLEYRCQVGGLYCTKVFGDYPRTVEKIWKAPDLAITYGCSEYNRTPCEPPSAFDSIRARLEISKIYKLVLVALGFTH